MFYAVYDVKTGLIEQVISIPEPFKHTIELKDGQSIFEADYQIDNSKEYIKNGELTPIN